MGILTGILLLFAGIYTLNLRFLTCLGGGGLGALFKLVSFSAF